MEDGSENELLQMIEESYRENLIGSRDEEVAKPRWFVATICEGCATWFMRSSMSKYDNKLYSTWAKVVIIMEGTPVRPISQSVNG